MYGSNSTKIKCFVVCAKETAHSDSFFRYFYHPSGNNSPTTARNIVKDKHARIWVCTLHNMNIDKLVNVDFWKPLHFWPA
jgi:hypothetical protein